jgi:hypothetical protein
VKVLHEPRLDTILMVEKAIIESDDYQIKTQLWKSLPKKMQYQTFKRVLDYLEAPSKIIYDDGEIIYVYPHSEKLKELIRSAVELK